MNRKLFAISLLFVITAFSAKAQEHADSRHATDQLQKQLSVYLEEHPSSNLYLHLDKNIYSPEETIWFKAYLLSDTVMDNKVLYVRIIDEHKDIVLSGQFPMYDIRAHGNLSLYTEGRYGEINNYTPKHGDIYVDMPKILAEGKYTLYAYTDRMLSYGDTNVFVQPIRIRKNTGKKLEAEARISDTTQLVRGGKVRVMAKIREEGKPASKVKGEYELRAGEKSIKYGRITTNESGEAFINFTYPQLADSQSLRVNMLFARDNDYAELSLNLPHEGNPLTVNIHPEGGQLIAGTVSKVAIEILDIHGNPVETGLLLRNGEQPITKLKTDKLGIATINLKSETGSGYTVETTGKKKQAAAFPEVIKPGGYSLKLHSGKDTVIVHNQNQPGDALLVLRSLKEILWSMPLTIAPGDSVTLPLPATDFAKDILSLAVFDHENRPQAERLFLNREEEDYRVTILTDRQKYGMQEKVTVTINASDTEGNPIVANLSVATTQKNRIDSAEYRTILQSWHYRPFGRTMLNRFLSTNSADEMDGVLRTNSWDNNTWNKINGYLPQGPPVRLNHTDGAIGKVVFNKGPLFSPHSKVRKLRKFYIHSVRNHTSLNEVVQGNMPFINRVPVELDDDYQFYLPASSLISRKGEEWILDIYESNSFFKYNFLVEWKDHDIQFDSTVVKTELLDEPAVINSFASDKIHIQSPFDFKGLNQLEEVTIGGKEKTVQKKLRKQCPDRMCNSGTYNCTLHTNYKLIKGMISTWGYTPYGTPKVATYLGCTKFTYIHDMKNITLPEEFFLPDYDIDPSSKEDTRSTVYWNPNILTDENGNATFSFFTSDIQGEFEIMVQGLEVNTFRPLMGSGTFKVTLDE